MNNPFKVGCEVTGESFIGREKWIDFFNKGILKSNEKHGSVSLTGIPRIGKSSLAYNAFKDGSALKEKNIYYVSISTGDYENFSEFWSALMRKVYEKLEGENIMDSDDTALLQSFITFQEVPVPILKYSIERFFQRMCRKKVKFVIVIDEFDFAERTFGNNSSYFQFLRGLIARAEYNISFVVISRRSIVHIESNAFGGSNLAGVLQENFLRGFDDDELREYFKKFEDHGLKLTDDNKKEILFYAGRSPFLLSTIGQFIINDGGKSDIHSIYSQCCKQFLDYYNNIISLLKDEGLYDKMLQVYVGPKYNLKSFDVDNLVARGYITIEETGASSENSKSVNSDWSTNKYRTISEHFVEYLKIQSVIESEGIWTILTETEKQLRLIIEKEMLKMFGANWQAQLEIKDAALRAKGIRFIDFIKVKRYINNNNAIFGNRTENNILKVISISELTNILSHYWTNIFAPYFCGKLFSDWSDKFNTIARARNPLAHGTPEYLTDLEIRDVELSCQQILDAIKKNNN